MTKVLLLNIDSKLPNIALKKVEMWHTEKGDEVIWDMPLMLNNVDWVYVSCIFTRNHSKAANYKGLRPGALIGGTGYDLMVKLPGEIEAMKPKINYGFTTRGCIRRCPFCFVPQAEGGIRRVGDIYDIWDGESPLITLLDNNILALHDHFENICHQVMKEGLTVDFNQGLDIRLVTPKISRLLSELKTKDIRFAFDSPAIESIFRSKIRTLRENGLPNCYFFVYVLVGYDTTFEEDVHRLNVLKELNCRPYVMRHENTPKERRYNELASWTNQMWTFAKYDFPTYYKMRVESYGKQRA